MHTNTKQAKTNKMTTFMFTDGYTISEYAYFQRKGMEIDPNQIVWVNSEEEAEKIMKPMSNEDSEWWLRSQIYFRVNRKYPHIAPKITGMFIELERDLLLKLIVDEIYLNDALDEAIRVLREHRYITAENKLMSEAVASGEKALFEAAGKPIYCQPVYHIPMMPMPVHCLITKPEYDMLVANGTIITQKPVEPTIINHLITKVSKPEKSAKKMVKDTRRTCINISGEESKLEMSSNVKCSFCRERGHFIRVNADPDSAVICPVLAQIQCTICNMRGHTKKMCQQSK
jgi:hypothetical protein